MEVECIDVSGLPFVNPDLEIDSMFPGPVEAFRQKILAADCILFATPEYNYSIPRTTIVVVAISSNFLD